MKLSPPGLVRHSSRATPSLRDAPTPAKHNRQRFHLASGDPCPDNPGHRLCPACVKAQKTDDRDAEAIAKAATLPTMRFVTLKSEAQFDLQSLHRARERLVLARTALINQLRAGMLERGTTLVKGRAVLMRRLEEIGS